MILEVRDVAKRWTIERTGEQIVALESITLDVAAGEFIVLLGPSGCGKSTLLQIVAGLESASSGTVRFPGVDQRPASDRKRTSMVFQE